MEESERRVAELRTRLEEMESEQEERAAKKEAASEDRFAILRSFAVLAGLVIFALLVSYFLIDTLAFLPIKAHSYYFAFVAVAGLVWYKLMQMTRLSGMKSWQTWNEWVKKVGLALILIGGLWQGLEAVLRFLKIV